MKLRKEVLNASELVHLETYAGILKSKYLTNEYSFHFDPLNCSSFQTARIRLQQMSMIN